MAACDSASLTEKLDSWYPDHKNYGQLIPGVLELNQALQKPQDAGTTHVITGSFHDGSVVCSHRMESVDIDLLFRQVKEVFSKNNTETLMKPAEGYPGYIIIEAGGWLMSSLFSLWVTEKQFPGGLKRSVLSPEKAKDHIGTDLQFLLPGYVSRKDKKVSQLVHQVFLTLAAQDRDEQEIEGLVNPSQIQFFPLNLDCVPAAQAEGWPESAKLFFSRKRRWPDQKTLSEIKEGGFHVVPKSPPDGDPDLHWRLSFSLGEAKLTTAMSILQRKCYSLMKLIIYDVLKELKERRELAITTYHSKTVVFWSCENKTDMWMREDLGECMLSLLDDLLKCLSEENLPMYFIPENNLLKYTEKGHLREEVRFLRKFRCSLTLRPSPAMNLLPKGLKGTIPDMIMPFVESHACLVLRVFIDKICKTLAKACRKEQEGLTNEEIAKKCVYDATCEALPFASLLFPEQEKLFPPGDVDTFHTVVRPALQGRTVSFTDILTGLAKALECALNTIWTRYHNTEMSWHAQKGHFT